MPGRINSLPVCYISPGMPPLEPVKKAVSIFEFWPVWLIYLPVILQWIGLSIRYRSFSLPLIANPVIPLSGMVGFSKSALLSLAAPKSKGSILPFITHRVKGAHRTQMEAIEKKLKKQHLTLPLVGKPDIGCRGAGVRLLETWQDIANYLAGYPEKEVFMLQKLASWEPEAGVFYVRQPGEKRGKIISLALKYTPYLMGDGRSTLAELLEKDQRAGPLKCLYEERHRGMLQTVISAGKPFRLVFSASHCRGALFRNGKRYITHALARKLDAILSGLPEFHYGRLDIKFRDTEHLMRAEQLEIVEINGASSESLHIWDARATLRNAWKTLLHQYNILFHIGRSNRGRGFRPPGISVLWRAWKNERELIKQYPATD